MMRIDAGLKTLPPTSEENIRQEKLSFLKKVGKNDLESNFEVFNVPLLFKMIIVF